jgi:hypothetical protein
MKNKPEQTQKQSGEFVENGFLWKKQTQNKPGNKPGHVVENTEQRNFAELSANISRRASKLAL